MGFGQLYYTSCERGLAGYAGYAGFQFVAASADIAPEVMRAVEALTAYEPPRSIGYQPTPEEVANAPRNLCFAPGASTVLANVVYVGTDFSQRSGNYFVHALVSAAGTADLEPLLPIELWKAEFWTTKTTPAQDTALLPELARPPDPGPLSGPLGRREAGDFVRRHRCGHRLATMLTAVEQSVLGGDRSVVVVEPQVDGAAHWIAAASFLLPPRLARRMSFATYHHRPSYSQLNVIGTVADADIDLTDAAFDDYYLFDFVRDKVTELTVHPLAELLSAVGVVEAKQLWERAESLAVGSEQTLDHWHPVVAAAIAATGSASGVRLRAADLVAATRWLVARGSGVGGELAAAVGAVGAAVLDDPVVGAEHIGDLATLAELAGDTALLVRVEQAAVVEGLRRLRVGGESTRWRLTTADGRAFGAQRCAEQLRSADPAEAVRLLGLAADLGVELRAEALRSCGEQTLGPHLLRHPDDSDTIGVLAGDRHLLAGTLAHLAAEADLAGDAVIRVLAAGVRDGVVAAGIRVDRRLHELMAIAAAQNDPAGRFPAFKKVVSSRARSATQDRAVDDQVVDDQAVDDQVVDDRTLWRIWPAGVWPVRDAVGVIRLLGAEQLGVEPCRGWLSRTVTQPFPRGDPDYLSGYVLLCRELAGHGVVQSLPAGPQKVVGTLLDARAQVAAYRSTRTVDRIRLVGGLCRAYLAAPIPTQEYLLASLPAMIAGLTDAKQFPAILAGCPDPVVDRYLDDAGRRLAGPKRDPKLAAALFRTLHQLREMRGSAPGRLAGKLDKSLQRRLREWKRSDLAEVHRELSKRDLAAAKDFERWRNSQPSRLLGRVARLLARGGGPGREK